MKPDLNINKIIRTALQEDIGQGDITTQAVVPDTSMASGRFIAKENGVICGIGIAGQVFRLLDPSIEFTPHIEDGQKACAGDVIASVSGPAAGILSGERVALNFLQRLSGIASRTATMVAMTQGTKAVIADTRKTTPGLRILEKYAVRTGGGKNHRFNLAGGILIKDNHIRAAGGIGRAVEATRKNAPPGFKIEVEVENLNQLDEALVAGADIVMLDNMDIETIKEAVKRAGGRALLEASGKMDEKRIKEVATTGVDIISAGALTHSVISVDISLRLD